MSTPAHFDHVASLYRWMEYLSFGPWLERCRQFRMAEMAGCRRALIYGDGDGRFLARLARQAPAMEITAVDASRAMLRHAEQRLPPQARVTFCHADALEYVPSSKADGDPTGGYDLIISHFFLDCFSETEVAVLVERVLPAAATGAVWVVSDFAEPRGWLSRPLGRLVVQALYLAFRVLTGLQARQLPDHARVLRAAGWVLEDRRHMLAGLLTSERWRWGKPAR